MSMRVWSTAPLLVAVIVISVLSGLADARGFVHAARVWDAQGLVWRELGRSALGFALGIAGYWLAVRYLQLLGVLAPEVQTLVWFGVTMLGVALASGKFASWRALDQVVALAVLAGIGWLMFHTSTS